MPRPGKKQKGPPARGQRPGPQKGQQAPVASQSKSKAKGGNPAKSGAGEDEKKNTAPLQANQRPIVPFLRGDRILLVGEGDFSFARSLATQYKCRKLCATSYDSQETLLAKYPQAEQNIQDILNSNKPRSKPNDSDNPAEKDNDKSTHPSQGPKILYSVDAKKLGIPGGGGGKEIKFGYPRKEAKRPAWKIQQQQPKPTKIDPRANANAKANEELARELEEKKPVYGPWDVICFNFPHVGGLSTDVNRQVRSNQELLVAFFKACVPLLSGAPEPVDSDDEWSEDEEEESEDEDEEDEQVSGKTTRTGPGQILVSIFEAEPYTLWNIKDLARHAGLQVVTSFRFPWSSYEGYSHARTLGEVEGKNGERGGWRGEDREARMYVFEVREEPAKKEKGKGKKEKGTKKRTREESDDSD
ncbi:uncharacterized protein N7483_001707 [Penicillium malachiteum]|uniref:uncharacterized protein n=1 Tax=Penicillium malachiteum TaxID=1324776 RepID=UPI002549A618|nr:uncharacterized protein N7483_001707 [Penicillium malachiteum]KAJ5736582.1 hypothetical protein N7483_001707 [Penicillium malachiteum]